MTLWAKRLLAIGALCLAVNGPNVWADDSGSASADVAVPKTMTWVAGALLVVPSGFCMLLLMHRKRPV